MGGLDIPASVKLIASFVRRTGGSEEFAYTPVEEEKNGREIAKIAFPCFSFLPIESVVPSDQSVFITIARDFALLWLSLLCYETKRDFISNFAVFYALVTR
jgi:hypothetical protein